MARNALVGIAAAITLCAGTRMALAQVGTAFTYQGQLKDSGTAVNGTADMQFSLWTAASGGSQVGSTVTTLAVPASEGLVTTSVDFGANPYGADQALYLQVSVRTPAGAGAYVPMTSRQKLTAAPFSLATRGINVNSIGDVAVGGATEALVKLKVTGNDPAFGSVRIMDDANDGDMTFDGGNDGGAGIKYIGPSTGTFSIFSSTTPNLLNILASGSIGVGTTTPATGFKFDVAGASNMLRATLGDRALNVASVPLTLTGANNSVLFDNTSGASWNLGGSGNAFFIQRSGTTNSPLWIDGTTLGIGMGTNAPTAGFKLDVIGNIRCVSLTQTSSREFKQNIVPLSGALESIMKLQGVSYAWNDKAPEAVRGGHDIGFIAEEMNAVLPDIVAKDENGKPIGIDYGKITPVTVEAIKQLKNENDQLKARLERLEAIMTKAAR